MSTLREMIQEQADVSPDPAVYLREARASLADDTPVFWGPKRFRSAIAVQSLEPLEGLTILARSWRKQFVEQPDWNPADELRALVLSSDSLTIRDKRQFEAYLNLAAKLTPRELARKAKPVLMGLDSENPGERAWRQLLLKVIRDISKLSSTPKPAIMVPTRDETLVPRVLAVVMAYLRTAVALEMMRKERIEFLVRRLRQVRSVCGIIDGPGDLAKRHTDYALPPRR